ncbi:MAG TPA: HlyD family secretion protein [Flammeovirgaceae bacterium]|nr:HlyD family secretion protein [Flammeovirgaceae bacterium]
MVQSQKKSSSKIIWILFGAFIVLIGVAYYLNKGNKKTLTVETDKPRRLTIVEKISASGMVQPVTEVKLSPDVAGEIIELTVEEGDSVTEGQLLVKIRPDNYISAVQRAEASLNTQIANLQSAKANLARAKATYERAKLELARSKKLFEGNVISSSEWEQAQQSYKVAENDYKAAQAAVDAARYMVKSSRAALDDAKENLRKTSVYAPMSGIVSKLSVEKGERVVGTSQFAGTEMLRIANLNDMEVRVDVNENDIIRIELGDTAIIDVDAYTHLEKTFKGIVTHIANTAKDKVSADAVTEFEVRIKILPSAFAQLRAEGYKYPFKPGMTASVDIITETKENVLAVPLAAVTTRAKSEIDGTDDKEEKPRKRAEKDDKQSSDEEEEVEVVFVVQDGEADLRQVETGISDYEHIEIVKGIAEDETVITGPYILVSKRLKDGDPVRTKEEEESKRKKFFGTDKDEK